VGSGVNVGEIYFVGREEAVTVAIPAVGVLGTHADSAIVPTRRLNKMYFLIVENLNLGNS